MIVESGIVATLLAPPVPSSWLSHPLRRVRWCDEIDERAGRGGPETRSGGERRPRPPSACPAGRTTTPAASTAASPPRSLSGDDTVEPPGVGRPDLRGDARSMDRVRPVVGGAGGHLAARTSPARPTRPSSARATSRPPTSSTSRCSRTCSPSASRSSRPGGRIAVNVANLGRKPYRSLSADVIGILQDRLGLLLRGEVIWRKARGAGANCAWGSFKTPANPVLRDLTERVVIASKGRFDRARPGPGAAERGPAVGGHHHRRRVHGRHPRRVGAGARERRPASATRRRSRSSCRSG